MHETVEDLRRVQQLLDESYQAVGTHLREVITPERTLTAIKLSEILIGMRLLMLSTVTKDCRPIAGPVDGIFYRGNFYFGSSPVSTRFFHIKHGSSVSATHLPGEELFVTVHGSATPIDIKSPQHGQFRQTLLDIYVPRYGKDWKSFSIPVRCMRELMRPECLTSLCHRTKHKSATVRNPCCDLTEQIGNESSNFHLAEIQIRHSRHRTLSTAERRRDKCRWCSHRLCQIIGSAHPGSSITGPGTRLSEWRDSVET